MTDREVPRPGETTQAKAAPRGANTGKDLVCLSHLRWDFVYQRPQHLLSRAARGRRVFFIEEPGQAEEVSRLEIVQKLPQLWIVVPHLPQDLRKEAHDAELAQLTARLFEQCQIDEYVLWFYTPNSLRHARDLSPAVTVYDCMDELSMFKGADPTLRELENELFQRADFVFTGGQSLYEAKRDRHPNVYLFPSSIDRAHFGRARTLRLEPADQAGIPHPRLGFFGVIDERMDLELLDGLSETRPEWQIVVIGPVAKIDKEMLPQRPNIHYLGAKAYEQLPEYLAGWDVAIMPFAQNDATRFISPTKTPEYLAGGKPVVSTSIRDVVRPYGQQGLVRVAEDLPEFVAAVGAALGESQTARQQWLEDVDAFLVQNSWDLTWARMEGLIDGCA